MLVLNNKLLCVTFGMKYINIHTSHTVTSLVLHAIVDLSVLVLLTLTPLEISQTYCYTIYSKTIACLLTLKNLFVDTFTF